MMNLSKYKWTLLILVLNIAAVIYFAGVLPAGAKVPMHWNIKNQIDGWTTKTFGLWFGLGMNVLMFLLLWLMPWYSPWYRKYRERYERVLPQLCATLVFFFFVLSTYSLYVAKWGEPKGVNLILALIGFLFIFLGNLLPKVPKNFFIGIKTPWTLSNEVIWDKTHRLGGIMFVVAGFVMIKKSFVLTHNHLYQNTLTVCVFALLLYPLLHSFILYKKLGKG
jgi:uncharacterized membrane protein